MVDDQRQGVIMTVSSKLYIDELAANIVGCFPALSLHEQRLSVDLYCLLADGQPVPRSALAERLGISIEKVTRTLNGWPGIFYDARQRIVGYWGLSIPTAYDTSFCHFVHSFPLLQGGETWAARHRRAFLLSIHEAHDLAHLKNKLQYGALLRRNLQ
jgi:alkylmercury lyase-like protein